MKILWSLLAIVLMLGTPMIITAQEEDNESPITISADMVTRYVWRGLSLSKSPAIQPSIEYSLGNFTIGTWGSYTFGHEELQEVDLYASYSLGTFSITLNDYYNPNEFFDDANQYFEWNGDSTLHSLELVAAWEGTENFPIMVSAGLFFYGNDRDETGDNYYSTYAEIGYPFEIKGVSLQPFAGFTFAEGYYSDGFDLVNLGIKAEKEISVTESFSLPVSASFITNPAAGQVFLVFGMSF